MKRFIVLIAVFTFLLSFSNSYAQTKKTPPPVQHGRGFVDKNGDGYNDNAPDHDGDGIPNGLDPDYKGPKLQKNKFVDLNGDGINNNAGKGKIGNKKGKRGYGAKNAAGTCIQRNSANQGSNVPGYNGVKK